jgi:hypothetical protein
MRPTNRLLMLASMAAMSAHALGTRAAVVPDLDKLGNCEKPKSDFKPHRHKGGHKANARKTSKR